MHKYQLLRQRAEEFRFVLEEYAQNDSDVADFLERWMPWYERIQRREIRLPCNEYSLDRYFINPDASPLADRYGAILNPHNRLFGAAGDFFVAMRDWLSDPSYLTHLRKIGELPDLIPDEPPPAEEETPLSPSEGEPEQPIVRKGWLHRWVFGEKK